MSPKARSSLNLIQSQEQGASPVIKVKDEPADDDEYEQALISPTSAASVKDEPNAAKVGHKHPFDFSRRFVAANVPICQTFVFTSDTLF